MRSVDELLVEAIRIVKGVRVPSGHLSTISLIMCEIDSLDLVEICMIIEEQMGTKIDPDRFDQLVNLGDLLEALHEQME